jgi:hypothetical protein
MAPVSVDVREARFIFTIATGRCGQATLAETIHRHVAGAYAAFEEPQVRAILPAPLDGIERRFRRRFVETHELLGRGKVLQAFESGDYDYIESIAERRLELARHEMTKRHASVYFDVSKFFGRGLHVGFMRKLKRLALVNLVRDPVDNMRSFLNRNKLFELDNSMPHAKSNILCLDAAAMQPGELYLWAWCELYLRFQALREMDQVTQAVEIRTKDLEDGARMDAAFDALGLAHSPVKPIPAQNTNQSKGLPPTRVTAADIRLFERFIDRVPGCVRDRIGYLADYDPWAQHEISRMDAA